MNPERYLGLISGTSRDGVDVAVVRTEGAHLAVEHTLTVPYPDSLRVAIDALIQPGRRPAMSRLEPLDRSLGEFFAACALKALQPLGLRAGDITAVGSHGQTVWHEPEGPNPVSIQLGHGPTIAQCSGITTVYDFRRADLAAGGQGAPLAPLLHEQLFRGPDAGAVLNLGGIANLTLLQGPEVYGFDTGPANCLLDLWVQEQRGLPYDEEGRWAASGTVLPALLEQLLDEPYFQRPAPKSTGLEHFNRAWLARRLAAVDAAPEDIQATLLALTVETVAAALEHSSTVPTSSLWVCGGGVHNRAIMTALQQRLPGIRIASTAAQGVNPDALEALLFAWLARERLAGRPLNTPPVTGARHAVLLGTIARAQDQGEL